MKFTKKDTRVFDAFCLVAKESQYRTDITLDKIAEKLDMSRQNLTQTYYKNVNEIISNLHYYVDQDIKEAIIYLLEKNPDRLLDTFADDVLPLLYERRDYLSVLYGDIADPTWFGFLEDVYFDVLFSYFSVNHAKDKNALNFMTRIIIGQIISVLSVWLTDPNPESPITFSKKFAYLMSHSTNELLDSPKSIMQEQ